MLVQEANKLENYLVFNYNERKWTKNDLLVEILERRLEHRICL